MFGRRFFLHHLLVLVSGSFVLMPVRPWPVDPASDYPLEGYISCLWYPPSHAGACAGDNSPLPPVFRIWIQVFKNDYYDYDNYDYDDYDYDDYNFDYDYDYG